MTTVNMLEAKTNLSKLVEAVESGAEAEITIARNGKPVARLMPLAAQSSAKQRLGVAEGKYADFSLEEFNAMDDEIARMFLDGPIFPDQDAPKTKKPA